MEAQKGEIGKRRRWLTCKCGNWIWEEKAREGCKKCGDAAPTNNPSPNPSTHQAPNGSNADHFAEITQ